MSSIQRSATVWSVDASIGTQDWTFIDSDPDYYYTPLLDHATTSKYLVASGFDFSAIGDSDQIDGIVAEVECLTKWGVNYAVKDNLVKLYSSGAVIGNDRSNASVYPTITKDYLSHGALDDDWDASLSAAILKASGFGLAISAKLTGIWDSSAHIYNVRMTVYYTPAPPNLARVTQEVIEVAESPNIAKDRVSQSGIELAYTSLPPNLKVSQNVAEILEMPIIAKNRISQSVVELILGRHAVIPFTICRVNMSID
jgi:hypothetical protein